MGTHLKCLIEAVLISTHYLCFEQKYEKYQNFLSENFHSFVVKFSVYLNRQVFVMCQKVPYLALQFILSVLFFSLVVRGKILLHKMLTLILLSKLI